jgi:uncharacterized protein YggE
MDPEQITPRITEHIIPEKKLTWATIGEVILGLIILTIFWQWISSPMIVTVTGSGEVNVPASNATVTFSLTSIDATPQGAISSVTSRAAAITQVLIKSGIAEEDIAQSQVYAVPANLVVAGATGFQASIAMSAKTVHVSNITDLISSLYANGASAVSQPVLSVENEQALDAQAYNSAVKDAKAKAASIGLQNWKFIRKIIAVNSQSSGTTSTATSKADTLTGSKDDVAARNGVFKIVESVSVSYKMW